MSASLTQRRTAAASSSDTRPLQPATTPSDTTPVVPNSVIQTLLLFTAAMVTFPIASYFLTVNTIFRGNSTFAGGFAALMANVVLIGYVFIAWKDDQEDFRERRGNVGTGVRSVEAKEIEGRKEK